MKPVGFSDLPVELICHVLAMLSVRDLIRCSMVNKRVRTSILDSSRLQYTIELAIHGMVSVAPPASSTPFTQRLKLLREREAAWKSLSWKSRHTLALPPTGSIYEFVGGFYGNGREDASRIAASLSLFQLPSSTLDLDTGEMRMWTHDLRGYLIIDFTMDPSQDLLVLVALAPADSKFIYELHLRTLSTNEPHPSAQKSKLCAVRRGAIDTFNGADISASVRVQVAGKLVALLIKEVFDIVGAHLEIWNWAAGPQHSASMSRMPGIDDFCFLSHDTFLIVKPSGKFEVCTFQDPANISSTPVSQATYAFPPLAPNHVYWYISMSSNPAAGYVPDENHTFLSPLPPDVSATKETDTAGQDNTGSAVAQLERPDYYPRADERIHACCVYVFNPNPPTADASHVHSFVFFMNIKTFLQSPSVWENQDFPSPALSACSDTTAVSGGSHPSASSLPLPTHVPSTSAPVIPHSYTNLPGTTIAPPVIPWDVWGPQSTRWFHERLSTDWQHALYGYRTVESMSARAGGPAEESAGTDNDEDDDDDDWMTSPKRGKRRLRIRDYNPYSVWRAQNLGNAGASSEPGSSLGGSRPFSRGKVVTAPSTLTTGGVFQRDVVSSLPYLEVISEETFDVTDVMLDDCRVLLLKRAPGGTLSGIDVLTI